MFFLIRFIIVWSIWLVFADKSRWRELFLVGVFAGFLGAISDHLSEYFNLWEYRKSHTLICHLFDDIGIYLVTTYLFIQWLPKNRRPVKMIGYWFVWTLVTMTIEWIHVKTGHMSYGNFWNLGWSYLCNWVLFWLFYQFHKVFRLERLNGTL